MIRSSLHGWIGSQNLSRRDQIGMLLALLIGLGGLAFVFLLPDPILRLVPQIPVLSPQDWSGSHIGTELFLTDNLHTVTGDPWRPVLWEERRGFYQSLYLAGLAGYSDKAFIDHTVVWYADPSENAETWKELDTGTYNSWPIVERRPYSDKPASFLACNPDPGLTTSPPQCWYFAYWEHWFTAVFFWRQEDEDLLMQDIHQLTARIDQLLMSAPEEPCYGFLCTTR